MVDLNVVNDVDPVSFKKALMENYISTVQKMLDQESGSEILSRSAMIKNAEDRPKFIAGGDPCEQGTLSQNDFKDRGVRKAKEKEIDGYRMAIYAGEEAVLRLDHFPSSDGRVRLWSYVEIDCHVSERVKKYLIVSKVGAVDLGDGILTVPFDTPLGQAMLGINKDPVYVGDEISTVIKNNTISGEVLRVI